MLIITTIKAEMLEHTLVQIQCIFFCIFSFFVFLNGISDEFFWFNSVKIVSIVDMCYR